MKELKICETCGTQYGAGHLHPDVCPICNDDRQYVGDNGQRWTNMDQIKRGHANKISQINDRLYSIKTEPAFALGQRAFLLLSANGNILWDCIPLLDEAIIAFIKSKGGVQAIVFSHPHYYSTMNDWAAAFDCPVYIHRNDGQFVFYKGDDVRLWEGERLHLWDDVNIVHIGGHFPGSCLLQIDSLTTGGTVLCGDSLYIAKSKRHIAMMYSYPNQILLSKEEFMAAYNRCSILRFDSLHGAFEGQTIEGGAYEIFTASMKRYRESYEF